MHPAVTAPLAPAGRFARLATLVVTLAVCHTPPRATAAAATATATATAAAAANPAPAGRYVVGLSPFLDARSKDEVFRHLVRLMLEDLPLDASLWIYDAYHLRSVAQVNIPNVHAFESSKTRANQFKAPILELRQFLSTSHPAPGTNAAVDASAVRLPQFLDFVAENLTGGGRAPRVILLGSPLYQDAKEPTFAMLDGFFPSDGHLLATRERSVFGVKDRAGALPEVVVHWGFFGDPWVSDLHRAKVSRFWALFLAGQGARLATFTGDLPTVFNAVRAGAVGEDTAPSRHRLDPAQTKIEMLRITREIAATDWITGDLPSGPRPAPPTSSTGPLKIGIRWRGNLDLDLYARPRAHAPTLCFEKTRSPDGYYAKDHRSSPDREYEFIEFTEPVDVWNVEASVNFYQGEAAAGPAGEVRVEFEGRIYSGRFSIASATGNQGRGGSGQDRFWAPIDLPGLLGLR